MRSAWEQYEEDAWQDRLELRERFADEARFAYAEEVRKAMEEDSDER